MQKPEVQLLRGHAHITLTLTLPGRSLRSRTTLMSRLTWRIHPNPGRQDAEIDTCNERRSYTYSPHPWRQCAQRSALFQFYYTAALISFRCGIGTLGMTGAHKTTPHDLGVHTQGQGGWPDFCSAPSPGWRSQSSSPGWWHTQVAASHAHPA